MSNEVAWDYTSGVTLYFCRFQLNGDVFLSDGASDEVWGTGARDADDYDVAMTESGSSGHFTGHFDTPGNIANGDYRVTVYVRAGGSPVDADVAVAQGIMFWRGASVNIGDVYTGVNVTQISGDSTAADNLELMYDGTGYIANSAPASRDQIAALAGGVSIKQVAESSVVTQGTETNTYVATQVHDSTDYIVTDSGAGAGIDFYLQFDVGAGGVPIEFHMHGYYDEGLGATNSLDIQAYNFNLSAWQTIQTITNAVSEQNYELSLTTVNVNDDNEVRINFVQGAQEANSTMNINHAAVGYVTSPVTAAEMADAVWDELSTGHTDAGKAGEQLWTDIDAILVDTDAIKANLGQVHTTEDESPGGGGGSPDGTSGIAEGC